MQRLKTQAEIAIAEKAKARSDEAKAKSDEAKAQKDKAIAEAVGKRKTGDTSPGPSSGTRQKYVNCVINNFSKHIIIISS